MENLLGFGLSVILLIGLCHTVLGQAQPDITVTSVLDEPFLMEATVNGDTVYRGFTVDVMEALAKKTGRNFKIKLAADRRYGMLDNSTGQWNGMVGEVISGDADVAMLLTMTSTRVRDVAFTQPVMRVDPVAVLEKPKLAMPWKERLERMLEPIELSVWILVVLAFMFTGVLLFIVSSLNSREWRSLGKRDAASIRESETFTCINTFWFVISTMFWQGYVRAPRSVGGRLITAGWFSFVLLFILAYLSSLINFLPVSSVPIFSINSFSDLAENDGFVIGMLPGTSTHAYMKSANPDSVEGKLYAKAAEFLNDTTVLSSEAGIKLVTDRPNPRKGFAWVMESSAARYLISRQCSLYMVSDRKANKFTSIAVQNNSPLLNTLNDALLKLHETNEINLIEQKWFESNICSEQQEAQEDEVYTFPAFHPMDLATFSGAVLVLIIGIGLGCLVTPVECWINKRASSSESVENLIEASPPPSSMRTEDSYNHIPLSDSGPLDMPDGPPPPEPPKRESLIGTSTQV